MFLIRPLWAAAREAAAGKYGIPFPVLLNHTLGHIIMNQSTTGKQKFNNTFLAF